MHRTSLAAPCRTVASALADRAIPAVLAVLGSLALLACVALGGCRDDPPAPADKPTSAAGEKGASADPADPDSADPDSADPDSTSAPSCLLDRGGCKVAADAIEPCGELDDLAVVTVAQILGDPAAYSGKTLAVRGPLNKSGAGCTERDCEATCCNACIAMLTLGDPRSPDHIRLESTTRPGLYSCIGDESMTCCQVDPRGQEIVAQGAFHVVTGVEPAVHQLWASELCMP